MLGQTTELAQTNQTHKPPSQVQKQRCMGHESRSSRAFESSGSLPQPHFQDFTLAPTHLGVLLQVFVDNQR
jgi:hypothetical protein